jgi:hypothetical protein
MQNERGTHWSEGDFHFLGGARNDEEGAMTVTGTMAMKRGR